jgi:type IV fimbrial biogenesis protein FimT
MVELITAVAIASILLTIAAPSFSSLIANQQGKAVASELYIALLRTRSEAIARNANVTLSSKTGGWQNGWQVLDPANASNVLEDRNAATGATVSGPGTITYRGSGRIQNTTRPSFVIRTHSGSLDQYQCISIDLSGRPYMKRAATC